MWKLLVLLMSVSTVQAKSAAATPPEKEVKGSAPAAGSQREKVVHTARAVHEATALLPELATTVAEYAGESVVHDVLNAADEAMAIVGEIYALIRKYMPSKELLDELEEQALKGSVTLSREKLLKLLLNTIVTPERRERWTSHYRNDSHAIEAFDKAYAPKKFYGYEAYSVDFHPGDMRYRQWQYIGFVHKPTLQDALAVECESCKAVISCVQPWMDVLHHNYHKPGCQRFADVLGRNPQFAAQFKVLSYGQAAPADHQHLWFYTMNFFDGYIRSVSDTDNTAQFLAQLLDSLYRMPNFATMAAYCNDCELQGVTGDDTKSYQRREKIYRARNRPNPYFEKLMRLTYKQGLVENFNDVLEKNLSVMEDIFNAIRLNMPSRERLMKANADEILESMFHEVFTEKRIEELTQLESLYESNLKNLLRVYDVEQKSYLYLKTFHRPDVLKPERGAARMKDAFKKAGFESIEKTDGTIQTRCRGCLAIDPQYHNIEYEAPWVEPHYYHLPGCQTFAKLAKEDPDAFKVVAYGQEVPKDPEAYWLYTMGFFDRYRRSKKITKLNSAWARIFVQSSNAARLAEYCDNYAQATDEAARKKLYDSIAQGNVYAKKLKAIIGWKP